MNTQYIIFKKIFLGFLLTLSICFDSQSQIAAGYSVVPDLSKPGVEAFVKGGKTLVFMLDLANQAKVQLDNLNAFYQQPAIGLNFSLVQSIIEDSSNSYLWKQRQVLDLTAHFNRTLDAYLSRTNKLIRMIPASMFHTFKSSCGTLPGGVSQLPFKTPTGIINTQNSGQARGGQKRMLSISNNATLGHQVAGITNISLINTNYSLTNEDYSTSFLNTIFGSNEIALIGYDPSVFLSCGEDMTDRILAGQSGNYLYFMIASGMDSPLVLANELVGFGVASTKTILLDNGTSKSTLFSTDHYSNFLTSVGTSFITINHR